jgi:hypothetical protein
MGEDLVDAPPRHNISAQEYGYCEKVHDFLHSLFRYRETIRESTYFQDGIVKQFSIGAPRW